MCSFDLCFPYYRDDLYLVPELLGEAEPDSVQAFNFKECLNYEFHYTFLPFGLIPRLIVHSHINSEAKDRWRNGVILSYFSCRAAIIGDSVKRLVTVRIMDGQPRERREFLAIIRSYFQFIHDSLRLDHLDVQEKVPLFDNPSFSVSHDKLLAFERGKIESYPEYDGANVINVRVSDLLNGIEAMDAELRSQSKPAKVKHIFISYSHEDERYKKQLETHLTNLKNLELISFWHDRMIQASSEWSAEIDENLTKADIIIFMVSPDFLASGYCMGKEVSFSMERHNSEKAQILPIIVRPCDLKGQPFEKIQSLPRDLKPISSWKRKDDAWLDVSQKIRSIAEGQ